MTRRQDSRSRKRGSFFFEIRPIRFGFSFEICERSIIVRSLTEKRQKMFRGYRRQNNKFMLNFLLAYLITLCKKNILTRELNFFLWREFKISRQFTKRYRATATLIGAISYNLQYVSVYILINKNSQQSTIYKQLHNK